MRLLASILTLTTCATMATSAVSAPQILVGGGYGAPPQAEIKLAHLAEAAEIPVKPKEDPIVLARQRCGRVTPTYIGLLKAANSDINLAPADVSRMVTFPACFVINPQQKSALRLGSESLKDFASRVLGTSGPETLRALQDHNSGAPLAPSGRDRTLAIPFASAPVVYQLKPEASGDLRKAADALLATFPKVAQPEAVVQTDPSELRLMSGIGMRNGVPCDTARQPTADADWPFNVAEVLKALDRNEKARAAEGMDGARTIAIAVADNGVDSLEGADFTKSLLLINSGEIPGNHIDDDANGYVDDVDGATVLSNDPPVPVPLGTLPDREHGTLMASLAIGGPDFRRSAKGGATTRISLLPISMVQRTVSTSPAGNVVRYGYPSQGLSEALHYAEDRGAAVLNLSVGTTNRLSDFETLASQFNPITIVVAAGNDATDFRVKQLYPASYGGSGGGLLPNRVITVGASDRRGCLADFSGRGAPNVDILAPGVGITATGLDGMPEAADGTSQATALVSFTVALLKSEGLTSTVAIKDRLFATADRYPDLAAYVSSSGVLNIAQAISVHHDILRRSDGSVTWGRLSAPPSLTDLCDDIDPTAKGKVLRIVWQGGPQPLLVLWRAQGGARSELSCKPVSTLDHFDFTDEQGAPSTVRLDQIAALVPR